MLDLDDVLLDPDVATRRRVLGWVDAAVLVPVYDDPDRGLVLVLTERRGDLRRHAGEIAFPGGRRDPGEALRETALREAHEEIGLLPRDVRVAGALAPVGTIGTGYRVYPFVGVLDAPPAWRPEEGEVARVLEMSLLDLRSARSWAPLLTKGVPFPTVSYHVDGHLVWGATARLVHQLLRRLGPLLGPL